MTIRLKKTDIRRKCGMIYRHKGRKIGSFLTLPTLGGRNDYEHEIKKLLALLLSISVATTGLFNDIGVKNADAAVVAK